MAHIGIVHARIVKDIETSIKDDLSHTILYSLPINSIYALAALYEKDEQRASDLALRIGAAPTSFTPILDRLEKVGLIARAPHATDRRSIVISLTPGGKKLQRAVENAMGNAEVRYGGKQ